MIPRWDTNIAKRLFSQDLTPGPVDLPQFTDIATGWTSDGITMKASLPEGDLHGYGSQPGHPQDALEQGKSAWTEAAPAAGLKPDGFLFPSRIESSPHLTTRQYVRLLGEWVQSTLQLVEGRLISGRCRANFSRRRDQDIPSPSDRFGVSKGFRHIGAPNDIFSSRARWSVTLAYVRNRTDSHVKRLQIPKRRSGIDIVPNEPVFYAALAASPQRRIARLYGEKDHGQTQTGTQT